MWRRLLKATFPVHLWRRPTTPQLSYLLLQAFQFQLQVGCCPQVLLSLLAGCLVLLLGLRQLFCQLRQEFSGVG